MSILKFDNVSKIFYTKEHQTVALDKLSFEINEGEFVALIGPSGCGKTTILSLVCGLIEPTSGRVIRGGKQNADILESDDATLDFSTRSQARLVEMTNENSQGTTLLDTRDAPKKDTSSLVASDNSERTFKRKLQTEKPKFKISLFARPKESGDARVGYMLQRDQLFEWRTIERNVTLGLEIQHKNTPENIAKAQNLLKKYGLWEFRKHFPQQLSGGMRQRVALIRTLATNPDLLLLDEPFSALDFQTRLDVCDDVYEIIKKEKKTALLVTHDISEAISLADKIIVLTARPATLKGIHYTEMSDIDTPLHRRQSSNFSAQFEYLHNLLHNI